MVDYISVVTVCAVVCWLGDHMGGVAAGLGDYVVSRLGDSMSGVPGVGVGFGSTGLLCHVEGNVTGVLPHKKFTLANLNPGTIAQESSGIGGYNRQKH